MTLLPSLFLFATGAIVRLDGTRVTPAQVDQRVEQDMRRAKVAGMGISVVQQGRVLYQRTFGFADAVARRPLNPDTVMYAASFTKAMFAYVVMQLAEEGKFDLDRPIGQYLKKPLPEYPKYAELASDERWKKLTGRILLSHTAGFANFRFLEPDGKLRFHFDPGMRYAYSGEGINLLQFVLDDMGLDTGRLFEDRLIAPLGMKRTSPVWRPDFETDFANGHLEDGKVVPHNRRTSVRAAGSMDSTLADMTKFAAAVSKRQGLSKKGWETMWRPEIRIRSEAQFPTLDEKVTTANDAIRLSYGLGWGVFFSPHGRAVFKEGHDDGWENHLVCFDKRNTCMVIMSNSANADKTFRGLLEFVLGDKYTPWRWEGYLE